MIESDAMYIYNSSCFYKSEGRLCVLLTVNRNRFTNTDVMTCIIHLTFTWYVNLNVRFFSTCTYCSVVCDIKIFLRTKTPIRSEIESLYTL